VQAKVFELDKIRTNRKSDKIAIGFGSYNSISLGENLFITLVKAEPILDHGKNKALEFAAPPEKIGSDKLSFGGDFPKGRVLAYDLEIFRETSMGYRLNELVPFEGEDSVVYWEEVQRGRKYLPLPTFFIPDQSLPTKILHGSCRKLHGVKHVVNHIFPAIPATEDFGEDALVAADHLVSESVLSVSRRPSALFLTGDQIYADDVAGPLISHLSKAGKTLLGKEEKIRGLGVKLSDIKIYGRQEIVQDKAGFTSEEAHNHLISFGEYVAMYLFAWNRENWPLDMWPSVVLGSHKPEELSLSEMFNSLYVSGQDLGIEAERFARDSILSDPDGRIPYLEYLFRAQQKWAPQILYRLQLFYLKSGYDALSSVRRVLANIPTYMIFDDHEITDDWYLNKEWTERVLNSECGRQIITNGLVAYWAFQGWGNDPDKFDTEFIHIVLDFVRAIREGNDDRAQELEKYFSTINWSFSAPTDPQAIFVDTRTHRDYTSKESPANLVDASGLDKVKELANYKGTLQKPLIMVLPAPFFGFEKIEIAQEEKGRAQRAAYDIEAWHFNPRGVYEFLKFIAEKLDTRCCIFLSGDVHYAYSLHAFVQFKPVTSKSSVLDIIQLTSSALSNTGKKNVTAQKTYPGRIGAKDTTSYYGWLNFDPNPAAIRFIVQRGRELTNAYLFSDEELKEFKYTLEKLPEFDWWELRHYKKIQPLRSYLVGFNNIGLLTMGLGKITHELWVYKDNKMRSFPVQFDEHLR
jgi:hypothetical protein